MADSLLVFTAPSAGVRLIVASVPLLARDAARRHGLAAGSSAALGQALVGTLLLVAAEEGEAARVDLQIDCEGPLRGLLVDADASGAVRGMARVNEIGEGELAALLGNGTLSVLRGGRGQAGEAHSAIVPFARGDLAEGLSDFLERDRELSGRVALQGANGVLVAPLSLSDRDAAYAIGQALRGRGLARLLEEAGDARALGQRIAEEHGLGELQVQSEVRPRFSCKCSRERVVAALVTLGAPELLDMADKDGGAEATCDFCAESYVVSKEELVALATQGERV